MKLNKINNVFFSSIDLIKSDKSAAHQFKINKHLRYIFGVAALMGLFLSCSSAIDIKILDLDKVNDDFNASAYYQKKLEQAAKTIATDPSKMDKKERLKKLDENLFAKDTLCFYTSAAFEGQYIHSKSDFSHRNKTNEGVFGFTYSTISWDENDSLAVLNGVYFQKLDMLEKKDGQLLSLNAMNESKTNNNYLKLVNHLKKKYGTATTLLRDKLQNLEILDWETAEGKIQLRTKIDTVENVLYIEAGGRKEVRLETKYTIDYFKVNKKYLKDLQKIKIGKWYLSKED